MNKPGKEGCIGRFSTMIHVCEFEEKKYAFFLKKR
jgi:hypothetical protein